MGHFPERGWKLVVMRVLIRSISHRKIVLGLSVESDERCSG
jgi:hypothetical protein